MAAVEEGAKQGRRYGSDTRIERITFEEYCAVGREKAEQIYQQEKSRIGFLFGWRQAGECNRTIFKMDDQDIHSGEQRIQTVQYILNNASKHLEALLPWRVESEVHNSLLNAYQMLHKVQREVERARDKI